MKNLYLIFAFLTLGFSATAANQSFDNRTRGEAFIFVERGVEFAVFPDGQFDFFFNPRGNFNRIPGHINYSFNSGYNYGPFIQYDDYGAVIQIENVPVYYDYYGRLIQAGRVRIGYNTFGMVDRIGNMFLHYNFYNQLTHTSGFINNRNASYVYRPWHDHYVRPYTYTVVHHQPYRLYYTPNRMKYSHYRNYYDTHYYNNNIQQRYYSPGDQVTSYQRGRRIDSPRKIESQLPTRITATPDGNERTIRTQTDVRNVPSQRMQAPTRTSRVETPTVQRSTAVESRSSRVEAPVRNNTIQTQTRAARVESPAVQRKIENRTRSTRVETPAVQRSVPQNTTPAREVQATTRRTEASPAANAAPAERTPEAVSTRGTRSSRGQ
ncbi:hypothetical protein HC174_13445 [Salinimicrobium sp. CDJ15-81-2]|nr:hypothetical protein [Salinimicrobium nanhaiense]